MIKPVQVSDIDALFKISQDVLPQKWNREDFEHFLDLKTIYAKCFWFEGQLASFFMGLLSQDDLDTLVIATDLHHQRKGYGRKILEHIQKDSLVSKIFLEVDTRNAPAIALYQSCGFELLGTRKKYYSGKFDAYSMRWTKSPN